MALSLFTRREHPEVIRLRTELEAERARAHQAEQAGLEIAKLMLERARTIDPISGPPSPTLPPPPGINLYAYDQPIVYSTPQPPTRRPKSLITTDTMRQMAATIDPMRAAIQHLKREVDAVPLKIVARDADDDAASTKKGIDRAKEFFSMDGGMGGQGRRRSQFEAAWIEDLLVIGASAFNFPLARGGKPFAMLAIDAATIRPRVDAFGWPGPTDHVYEQWIYGVQVAAFTRDELRYDGINALSYSPYFTSPVEMLLMPATTFVAEDEWNRRWLTDGTAPSEAWELPDTWTPEQVKAYAEWFTALMAGNTRERQQVKFVPGKVMSSANLSRKEHDFQALEDWLLHRICSIFGVQPSSIGYPGRQFKVSQEQSFDQTSNFGVGQILEFRKANYDDLLRRLGYDDLESHNVVEQEEKAGDRTDRLVKAVGAPYMSINQAKKIEGQEPVEGGDVILVPNTMTTLEMVVNPPEPVMAPATEAGSAAKEEPPSENGKPSSSREQSPARALSLWRKKAQARMKERGRATCAFEDPCLPEEIHRRVARGLAECLDAEDVRRVFEEALLPEGPDQNLSDPSDTTYRTDQLRETLSALAPTDARALIGTRWRKRAEQYEAIFGKPAGDGG